MAPHIRRQDNPSTPKPRALILAAAAAITIAAASQANAQAPSFDILKLDGPGTVTATQTTGPHGGISLTITATNDATILVRPKTNAALPPGAQSPNIIDLISVIPVGQHTDVRLILQTAPDRPIDRIGAIKRANPAPGTATGRLHIEELTLVHATNPTEAPILGRTALHHPNSNHNTTIADRIGTIRTGSLYGTIIATDTTEYAHTIQTIDVLNEAGSDETPLIIHAREIHTLQANSITGGFTTGLDNNGLNIPGPFVQGNILNLVTRSGNLKGNINTKRLGLPRQASDENQVPFTPPNNALNINGDLDADINVRVAVHRNIRIGGVLPHNRTITIDGAISEQGSIHIETPGGLQGQIIINSRRGDCLNNIYPTLNNRLDDPEEAWGGPIIIGDPTSDNAIILDGAVRDENGNVIWFPNGVNTGQPCPQPGDTHVIYCEAEPILENIYYEYTSAQLGGGAIGLVPFRLHHNDSEPPTGTEMTETAFFATYAGAINLRHYGPINKLNHNNDAPTLRITRRTLPTDIPTDVTDQFDIILQPEDPQYPSRGRRTVRVMPKNASVHGIFTITPTNELVCEGSAPTCNNSQAHTPVHPWVYTITLQPDCDNDGVDDRFQIAQDPSIDCNNDGIIDTCQINDDNDCDRNGILDECDIAKDPSLDLTGDGQLDPQHCWSPPPTIPCDIDGDGIVTITDYFAFLNAFFSQSPAADMNGDGHVTIEDYFYFLNCFFGTKSE